MCYCKSPKDCQYKIVSTLGGTGSGDNHLYAMCKGELGENSRLGLISIIDKNQIKPLVSQRDTSNNNVIAAGDKSNVGTILKKIIARELPGAMSCGDCAMTIAELNATDVESIKKGIDKIVEGISARAKKQAPKLWQRMAVTIDQAFNLGMTESRIKSWVEEAIASSVKKKTRIPSSRRLPHTKTREPIDTITPFPFTKKPKLNLICHCWPNGDAWRKHIKYLAKTDGVFDRRIMGVATGVGTAKFEEVKKTFGDGWDYFEVSNNPKKRELATYPKMMQMIESTDPNEATFCIHTKGTQDHTSSNKQIDWWTQAMYETVVYNWENVILEMEKGYSIAGSFRRFGSHFRTRHGWHYTGTFYAFRNARAFSSGIPVYDRQWWATESWVGHHFAMAESTCIFADNAGDLYKENQALEQQLTEWRKQNEN